MGTENENLSSFVLVSLTISPPTSLHFWRKPVHLQATAVTAAETSAISEKAKDFAVDERSCHQYACEEFTLLFTGVCFQLRGAEEKIKVV